MWKKTEIITIYVLNIFLSFLITKDLKTIIFIVFFIINPILIYYYWKITAISHTIKILVENADKELTNLEKRIKELEEKQ
jgi:Ca2+-dependent lipid-binding protein